jgi:hypothetical protein
MLVQWHSDASTRHGGRTEVALRVAKQCVRTQPRQRKLAHVWIIIVQFHLLRILVSYISLLAHQLIEHSCHSVRHSSERSGRTQQQQARKRCTGVASTINQRSLVACKCRNVYKDRAQPSEALRTRGRLQHRRREHASRKQVPFGPHSVPAVDVAEHNRHALASPRTLATPWQAHDHAANCVQRGAHLNSVRNIVTESAMRGRSMRYTCTSSYGCLHSGMGCTHSRVTSKLIHLTQLGSFAIRGSA